MYGILRILITYEEKVICNADGFGLFWQQPPAWSFSEAAVPGLKIDKSVLCSCPAVTNIGSRNWLSSLSVTLCGQDMSMHLW